ncbi:MAG: type II secretion system F family protein [Phycisphaerae bacterium]|nr:type II secretion system F family protein [Phycisphaerae bacterium]
MATFLYRTITTPAAATIEAPDRAAAVRELMRRGETPTSVEPMGVSVPTLSTPAQGADMIRTTAWSPRAMSRAETAAFIRELATALSAGLPLVQALRTMTKQGRTLRQKEMLESVIGEVEHGKSLADAMLPWSRTFGELTVNLVRAGEVSGQLAEVLGQAAELLDKDLKLRRSIVGAILYPFIICLLVVVAVIVVITFIVPNILKQLAGQATTLPWPTQVVKGAGEFFGGMWWGLIPGWAATLIAVTIGVLTFRKYYATPEGRLRVDTALLRLPLLGRLLRDVAVARFTRTLGTLTGAGIPILSALRVTRGTLGNRAMEGVIDDVAEQVAAGKTIAEPMERSGYFPPMLVQIVNLGERSGRLDQMLSQAARAFEERTEQSVKLFTTALPPVLVVGLACVVGFVVMAILLALLQVQDAAMSA